VLRLLASLARAKDTKVTKDTKKRDCMRPNDVSYKVIGAAMTVHTTLGAGLLESAYEKCLCSEFFRRSLQYRRQVRVAVDYQGVIITPAFTVDFIVENCLVLEIKSVEKLLPLHRAQLLSYLKLTGLPLGLLLNFKVAHLRDGIRRVVNGPEELL
jgi:GxxExxY protein